MSVYSPSRQLDVRYHNDPAPTWVYSPPRLVRMRQLQPDGTYGPEQVVVDLDLGAQDYCQRHGLPPPPSLEP